MVLRQLHPHPPNPPLPPFTTYTRKHIQQYMKNIDVCVYSTPPLSYILLLCIYFNCYPYDIGIA